MSISSTSESDIAAADGVGSNWALTSVGKADPAAATHPPAWLFFLAGFGPSWMVVDAVFIEVALMQQYVPERLALAADLSVSAILANTFVVPGYLALQARLRWRPRAWVLATILLQLGAIAPLALGAWRVRLGRWSAVLHASMFGVVVRRQPAAARDAAVGRRLRRAEPRLVVHGRRQRGRAHRGGARPRAVAEAPRAPTASSERFSVGEFYAMLCALVSVSFVGFLAIERRPPRRRPRAPRRRRRRLQRRRRRRRRRARARPDVDDISLIGDAPSSSSSSSSSSPAPAAAKVRRSHPPPPRRARAKARSAPRPAPRPAASWRVGSLTPLAARVPAPPRVRRICTANAIFQLACWVILRAIVPYAAAHVTPPGAPNRCGGRDAGGDGPRPAAALARAVQGSLVACLCGAALSARKDAVLRINLSYAAILLPLAVVIAMACSPRVIPFVASAPRWVGLCGAGGAALSPALLVMLCVVLRFADGYSTPLCYRTVADPFPERAARRSSGTRASSRFSSRWSACGSSSRLSRHGCTQARGRGLYIQDRSPRALTLGGRRRLADGGIQPTPFHLAHKGNGGRHPFPSSRQSSVFASLPHRRARLELPMTRAVNQRDRGERQITTQHDQGTPLGVVAQKHAPLAVHSGRQHDTWSSVHRLRTADRPRTPRNHVRRPFGPGASGSRRKVAVSLRQSSSPMPGGENSAPIPRRRGGAVQRTQRYAGP